jgi:hypothetical protein
MAGSNDFTGNKELAKQGVLSGELSMYAVSKSGIKSLANATSGNDLVIIPPVDDIISCYYYPYMVYEDLSTVEVDYDEEAYPLPYNQNCVSNLTLNRVKGIGNNGIRDVGTYNLYPVTGTTIGGAYNWRNEGKLWLPPYTTITAFDGLTEPIEINPLLLPNDKTTFTMSVRHSLNHLGAYTLYVDGYRGMSQGMLYGTTCTGLSFPVISNAYTSFMHDNQFQLKQQRYNNATNFLSGVAQSLFNLDLGKAFDTISSTLTSQGDYFVPIASSKLSGYQLTGQGSNSIHDLQFDGGMTVVHHQYDEEIMEQIGGFFHMYGYTQNKMMTPQLKTRRYFNYIKTKSVNLKASGVPKEHLTQLVSIFNEGCTFWHMDITGNFIGNYSKDNVER